MQPCSLATATTDFLAPDVFDGRSRAFADRGNLLAKIRRVDVAGGAREMADMGLRGKVAIVTGAGSRGDGIGNGRAASIVLAREGTKVALLDANQEWVELTKAMIDAEGGVC